MSKLNKGAAIAGLCVGASAFAMTPAYAQAAGAAQPVASEDAAAADQPPGEEIVVTGTRFQGRIATESPTPVDAISRDQLQSNGRTELLQMLRVEVPSFSITRNSAEGPSDYLLSPTLRGLGTGQVLVLVNGKRRHTTADLNNSNSIGRGDVAVDFNAIPTLALNRIEVLRDGAAAQYGSDAISGVINLILDRSLGTRAQGTYQVTDEGDGRKVEVSVSTGLRVGDGGVFRLTVSYQDVGGTNRARPDTRQQYFSADGTRLPSNNFGSGIGLTPSNGALDPREAAFDRNVFYQGETPYENRQIFFNFVSPDLGGTELYAFGGYNELKGRSQLFFRRPGQDETVRAIYPDGFRPRQLTDLQNASIAAGARGEDLAGFGWDLSTVYGFSAFDGTYANTNNVSLGAESPRAFPRGGLRFHQWTTNLDLTREISLGDDANPLRLAAGLEYRREDWQLRAGPADGFRNGGVPILDGPNRGRPARPGSQPTPANQPANARSVERDSYAVYAEAEKEWGRLLVQGALRHEEYSDFGGTTNYKIAGRYELADALALRGSFSTGFRAPALAQQAYNASNNLIISGASVLVSILAVDDPVARLVGATDLKPERSENLSVGAVLQVGGLTASLDAYRIEVRDRIAISTNFQDSRINDFLTANAFPNFSAVSFLTNAVDTTTRGIDVTASYRQRLGADQSFTATLAGNYNKTRFDRIEDTPAPLAALGIRTALFDLSQQVRFTDALPRTKVTLDLNYRRGPLSLSLTNTRFGEVSTVALLGRTPAQVAVLTPGYDVRQVSSPGSATNVDVVQTFGAEILTDLELAYQVNERVRVSVGAQNLFDVYPDENIASTVESVAAGVNGSDNAGTLPYNPLSPSGFSGRSFFVRLGVDF